MNRWAIFKDRISEAWAVSVVSKSPVVPPGTILKIAHRFQRWVVVTLALASPARDGRTKRPSQRRFTRYPWGVGEFACVLSSQTGLRFLRAQFPPMNRWAIFKDTIFRGMGRCFEIRVPCSELFLVRTVPTKKYESVGYFQTVDSDFGLWPSFGLRPSGFGFGKPLRPTACRADPPTGRTRVCRRADGCGARSRIRSCSANEPGRRCRCQFQI